MEFQSETSHSKNVGNFGSLLVSIEVLGSYYKPYKENLKLANLQLLHRQAKSVLQGVALASSVHAAAVDSRRKAWTGIDELAERILNLCDDYPEVITESDQVPVLLKKVRDKTNLVSEQAAISQTLKFNALLSQTSFEKRLESFEELIDIIKNSEARSVEKGKLLIASLEALQNNFKSKNISVKLAEAALNTARFNRDSLLYKQENNLITIAKEVKEYVKSTLGPSYAQYMQIMGTSFRAN